MSRPFLVRTALFWLVLCAAPNVGRGSSFLEGLLAEREGDYRRALERFEAVLAQDPTHLEALQRAAEAHKRLGQFSLAREKLLRGLSLGRKPQDVFRELAEIYSLSGEADSVDKYQVLSRGEEWVSVATDSEPASRAETFGAPLDAWWIYAAVGVVTLAVLMIGFMVLRKRRFSRGSGKKEEKQEKFSQTMRHAGDQAPLSTGDEDELDRQIETKRDQLCQSSAFLLGMENASLSDEGLEDRHLEQLLGQLETLRQALEMQDERARLYADIVRLQKMKIEALNRQLQLLR